MAPHESMEARWTALERTLKARRSDLAAKRGARDQLRDVTATETERLNALREEQQTAHQAQIFLLSEVVERRKHAITSIEQMGSAALRLVYGPGYRLLFEEFEEKRKTEGASNFRMEIKISSPHEGKELITGLMNERGGGVVEVVAFYLRIGALRWLGYDGPLLLDEAWKSMSNDEKLEQVARLLKHVVQETGQQIIFATHKADVFARYAHRIIHVAKQDGIAEVSALAPTAVDEDEFGEFV